MILAVCVCFCVAFFMAFHFSFNISKYLWIFFCYCNFPRLIFMLKFFSLFFVWFLNMFAQSICTSNILESIYQLSLLQQNKKNKTRIEHESKLHGDSNKSNSKINFLLNCLHGIEVCTRAYQNTRNVYENVFCYAVKPILIRWFCFFYSNISRFKLLTLYLSTF